MGFYERQAARRKEAVAKHEAKYPRQYARAKEIAKKEEVAYEVGAPSAPATLTEAVTVVEKKPLTGTEFLRKYAPEEAAKTSRYLQPEKYTRPTPKQPMSTKPVSVIAPYKEPSVREKIYRKLIGFTEKAHIPAVPAEPTPGLKPWFGSEKLTRYGREAFAGMIFLKTIPPRIPGFVAGTAAKVVAPPHEDIKGGWLQKEVSWRARQIKTGLKAGKEAAIKRPVFTSIIVIGAVKGVAEPLIRRAMTPTGATYIPKTGKADITAVTKGKYTIAKTRGISAEYKLQYPQDPFSKLVRKGAARVGKAPPKTGLLSGEAVLFGKKVGKAKEEIAGVIDYGFTTKVGKVKTTEYFRTAIRTRAKSLKHDILGIAEKRPAIGGFRMKGDPLETLMYKPGQKYFYTKKGGLITGEPIQTRTLKLGEVVREPSYPTKHYKAPGAKLKLGREQFRLTELTKAYKLQTGVSRAREAVFKKPSHISEYVETDPYFKSRIWHTYKGKMPGVKTIDLSKFGTTKVPYGAGFQKPSDFGGLKGGKLLQDIYGKTKVTTTVKPHTITPSKSFAGGASVGVIGALKPTPAPTYTSLLPTMPAAVPAITPAPSLAIIPYLGKQFTPSELLMPQERQRLAISPISAFKERAKTRQRMRISPMLDTRLKEDVLSRESLALREKTGEIIIPREITKTKDMTIPQLTTPGLVPSVTPTLPEGFGFGGALVLPPFIPFGGGGGFGRRGRRVAKKQKKKYKPSLTGWAGEFTIKKPPKGVLTGLEIRPLLAK